MDIHHLKIFISVHRNGSFSKASKELHISQPTISEHIKNLENELNCVLFDRLGRSILSTTMAERLLPYATQVVEEMVRLQKAMRKETTSISGDITISASTIPGTYLLPKMAASFKALYPATRFNILINDTAESIARVVSHEIHLAVTGGITHNKTLTETTLREDSLVCVVSPRLNKGGADHLASLPILIREKGSGTRRAMEDILQQVNIALTQKQIAATLGSTAAIKEALLAGLGFSILSHMAVKEEIASGTLKVITLPHTNMTRPIVLVSHKKRTLPLRYQAFIDMMLSGK